MREFLQRYEIRLQTLGPVHIGSGERLRKSEWIMEWSDDTAIIIDFYKFFELLEDKKLLAEYEKFVTREGGSLLRWMKEHDISRKERYEIANYTLSTAGLDLKNNQIRDMAMTAKDPYGLPYIPGSSLKGAIRNAILGTMIDASPYDCSQLKQEIRNTGGRINVKRFLNAESSSVNCRYFNTKGLSEKKNDAVNDMMSGIRISDSNSVGLDRLTLCQKVDAGPDGREHDIPLVRECIMPDTKFSFELVIDRTETNLTISFIEEAIGKFLEDYNRLFLKYFPEEKQYAGNILYLGGGTGFPTKTVLNQILRREPDRVKLTAETLNKMFPNKHGEDIRKGISPRTVKLTEIDGGLLQMGPCRIEFATV